MMEKSEKKEKFNIVDSANFYYCIVPRRIILQACLRINYQETDSGRKNVWIMRGNGFHA